MLNDASNIAAQATPHTVRLAEYQPPPFLIDHVTLTFDLDEAATRVTSRLKLRRNPAAPKDAPLRLDGEALTLVRLARDGEALGDNHYRIEAGALIIPDMPDACDAGDRNPHRARTTPNSAACTSPAAASSPSARPRASAASPISPTGRT